MQKQQQQCKQQHCGPVGVATAHNLPGTQGRAGLLPLVVTHTAVTGLMVSGAVQQCLSVAATVAETQSDVDNIGGSCIVAGTDTRTCKLLLGSHLVALSPYIYLIRAGSQSVISCDGACTRQGCS